LLLLLLFPLRIYHSWNMRRICDNICLKSQFIFYIITRAVRTVQVHKILRRLQQQQKSEVDVLL